MTYSLASRFVPLRLVALLVILPHANAQMSTSCDALKTTYQEASCCDGDSPHASIACPSTCKANSTFLNGAIKVVAWDMFGTFADMTTPAEAVWETIKSTHGNPSAKTTYDYTQHSHACYGNSLWMYRTTTTPEYLATFFQAWGTPWAIYADKICNYSGYDPWFDILTGNSSCVDAARAGTLFPWPAMDYALPVCMRLVLQEFGYPEEVYSNDAFIASIYTAQYMKMATYPGDDLSAYFASLHAAGIPTVSMSNGSPRQLNGTIFNMGVDTDVHVLSASGGTVTITGEPNIDVGQTTACKDTTCVSQNLVAKWYELKYGTSITNNEILFVSSHNGDAQQSVDCGMQAVYLHRPRLNHVTAEGQIANLGKANTNTDFVALFNSVQEVGAFVLRESGVAAARVTAIARQKENVHDAIVGAQS